MEQNALTKCNLGEKSKGGAISHAKSCPSQFLETNVGKHHSRQIHRESGEPIDLVRAHVDVFV